MAKGKVLKITPLPLFFQLGVLASRARSMASAAAKRTAYSISIEVNMKKKLFFHIVGGRPSTDLGLRQGVH